MFQQESPVLQWKNTTKTAVLVFSDGTVIKGNGCGAIGEAVGEICFNTAMTGYQEILTDPSYAEQIITFTFPHIGNVGTNSDDIETSNMKASTAVRGAIFKASITQPSNYRSENHFNDWLKAQNIIAISDIDSRALTAFIREKGMINAVIAHNEAGEFDLEALKQKAAQWDGVDGADLAKEVSISKPYEWREKGWDWAQGYTQNEDNHFHVVTIDYGIKRNILRRLASLGCKVTVVSAKASAKEILALKPDGLFLSNGPGDPAATGVYAVAEIQELIKSGLPIFGICLGHQLLSLALGASTEKMHQGHHGANHPVKDLATNKVEITSMNHGFTVKRESLPANVEETHISLFDNSNCGIRLKDKPVSSVQYHPEASPGPQDSFYLFQRFFEDMKSYQS